MNHYETVFILNPVLSDTQVKETVKKFEDYLVSKGAEMTYKEDWGLKKLAYPIQKKNSLSFIMGPPILKKKTGFYHLFEYKVAGEAIAAFELEFRRDDSIMRYLTVSLDKHAAAWAEVRKGRVKATKN
jgi:small subunit ribosomal protein S6